MASNSTYWQIDKADLVAKENVNSFDEKGVHSCCREYGNYTSVRKSPVASLGLGAETTVFLKCDSPTDLIPFYPSAVQKTHAQTLTILNDVANKFFDPTVQT